MILKIKIYIINLIKFDYITYNLIIKYLFFLFFPIKFHSHLYSN